MKKRIAWILAISLLATPAFAKSSRKKSSPPTPPSPPPAEVAAPKEPLPDTNFSKLKDWNPSASFGLGSIGGSFHLGVIGKYITPVDFKGNIVDVGAKTGFLLMTGASSGWSIPLLASASYELPNGGALRPYLGGDLGISIAHYSTTSVWFAATLNPGMHLSNTVFVEAPFGTLSGGFFVFPSIGMQF